MSEGAEHRRIRPAIGLTFKLFQQQFYGRANAAAMVALDMREHLLLRFWQAGFITKQALLPLGENRCNLTFLILLATEHSQVGIGLLGQLYKRTLYFALAVFPGQFNLFAADEINGLAH